MTWLVLHASPRLGNSAQAGTLLAAALIRAGATATVCALRDYRVAPCIACGMCAQLPGQCVLDTERTGQPDDAASLLTSLRGAVGLVIVAPVYFYGLPAHLKALVDRTQRYWADGFPVPPLRPAFAVFPAARQEGERLCEGSLLSLRPFVRLLGFHLLDHLELRGLDSQTALADCPKLQDRISAWGQSLPARACSA